MGGNRPDDPAGTRHEGLLFFFDASVVPVEEFHGEILEADVGAAHGVVEFGARDFLGFAAACDAFKAGSLFVEMQDEGFGSVCELIGDGVAAQEEAEWNFNFRLRSGHLQFAAERAVLGGLVGAHQAKEFLGCGGVAVGSAYWHGGQKAG